MNTVRNTKLYYDFVQRGKKIQGGLIMACDRIIELEDDNDALRAELTTTKAMLAADTTSLRAEYAAAVIERDAARAELKAIEAKKDHYFNDREQLHKDNWSLRDNASQIIRVANETQARLEAELAAEQQAHDQIAKICFAAGVETGDGTSVDAVKRLAAELQQAQEREAEIMLTLASVERAAAAIQEALDATQAKTCVWTIYDEDDSSVCGSCDFSLMWDISDPEESEYKFCPGCGANIAEYKHKKPLDEEEVPE
jgi:hypothetical protein